MQISRRIYLPKVCEQQLEPLLNIVKFIGLVVGNMIVPILRPHRIPKMRNGVFKQDFILTSQVNNSDISMKYVP